MPVPAAYPHLLAILIHLAGGGEQCVDEISKTPGLVETLLSFLREGGGGAESGDAVRAAKWRARGEVLALFAILCARGRKAAQSLLSQGDQPFLMNEYRVKSIPVCTGKVRATLLSSRSQIRLAACTSESFIVHLGEKLQRAGMSARNDGLKRDV